jgi:predicted nucleotidyltransferase
MSRLSSEASRVAREDIRCFVDDLVRRFHPAKVILFGSNAYGDPNLDSDVDLLVMMPHRAAGPKLAARILLACPHDFPVDLLVRSAREIARRTKLGDAFLNEVMAKGIVMHEASHA